MTPTFERRSPELVVLLSVVTCGLYLLYWTYCMYQDVEKLTGKPLTSTGFAVDLILMLVTCLLYGVWIDYRIAEELRDAARRAGMTPAADNTTTIVVLCVAKYLVGMLTPAVASAILQKQLNDIVAHGGPAGGAGMAAA